jgi:hypothetical protein
VSEGCGRVARQVRRPVHSVRMCAHVLRWRWRLLVMLAYPHPPSRGRHPISADQNDAQEGPAAASAPRTLPVAGHERVAALGALKEPRDCPQEQVTSAHSPSPASPQPGAERELRVHPSCGRRCERARGKRAAAGQGGAGTGPVRANAAPPPCHNAQLQGKRGIETTTGCRRRSAPAPRRRAGREQAPKGARSCRRRASRALM